MPDLTTTIKAVRDRGLCDEEEKSKLLEEVIGKFNDDTKISLSQVTSIFGVKDAYWFIGCFEYKDYCLLFSKIAESVLHLFEDKHPGDKRPRELIQGIKDCNAGKIDTDEFYRLVVAAHDAVVDAADDNTAAYWATDTIASAADPSTSAIDIATNAITAAEARVDARVEWEKNKKLLVEFIKS
jgi:hypothetical protein